jgi:hypothetical protein
MEQARYATIKTMIETLYQLTAQGKWDAVEAMLTDDFRIFEADCLPFGGLYEGKDALRAIYTKVFGFWEEPALDFTDLTISENHAVSIMTFHATSRHNGERLALPLCEVFHLRGEKICGITPYYYDTLAICRATGVLATA